MIRKIILPIIFAVFLSSTAVADDASVPQRDYAVGLNAGWVVGNGILWRLYSGQQFVQFTFAGLADREADEEYFNGSASYGRYFNRPYFSLSDLPLAAKWVAGAEAVYDEEEGVRDNRLNVGAGVGVDVGNVTGKGFSLSFDVFYTASFKGLKSPEFNSLMLEPSVGVLYNF